MSRGSRSYGVLGWCYGLVLWGSGLWAHIDLWPEKPTFLGFLIMVSMYSVLNRSVLGAKGRA